jgi:hypothetical protein
MSDHDARLSDEQIAARKRVKNLRDEAQSRDCRGFWPDVVEWLCDQLEDAWRQQRRATGEPVEGSDTLSDAVIAKMAREATFVDAQKSPIGTLLYLLQHETDDVIEQGLRQAIRLLKAQAPPALAANAPTSTDDSMRNSCDHCHTYHDGACDPFKLGFVAGKTWAASAPTVEQIQALRRVVPSATFYPDEAWEAKAWNRAINAVLALCADTRQPQTEPKTCATCRHQVAADRNCRLVMMPTGAERLQQQSAPGVALPRPGDPRFSCSFHAPAPRDGEQET